MTGDAPPHPLSRAFKRTYKDAGLTQVQLQDLIEVDQQTISKYARGTVRPPLDLLPAVEDACGVRRGHILRLAGYVDDAIDIVAAIGRDPDLTDEGRQVVTQVYDYCRRSARSSVLTEQERAEAEVRAERGIAAYKRRKAAESSDIS